MILVLLLSGCGYTAAEVRAKIDKVWLEHNVTVNSKKSMKVHVKFNVLGGKGKETRVCVWVESPKGTAHKIDDTANKLYNSTHFVHKLTPKSDNRVWNDFYYAIYIDELKLKPGKRDYYLFVTINNAKGDCLDRSDYVTFTGTGPTGKNVAKRSGKRKQSSSGNSGKGLKKWREELGYGGFVIVTEFANGAQQRVRWRFCPNCRGSKICASCYGSGVCQLCQGRGGIITAGYGSWLPCALCGQSGRCSLCRGSGQCGCVSISEYPGYAIGSSSFIYPDGTVDRETADYNNGGSSRSSSSSGSSGRKSKKRTCPDCGGTRLWLRGKEPEYAEPNSQLVGYYNSSGSKCPHCGHYDRHWHSKCATCKHYYGTENPYR